MMVIRPVAALGYRKYVSVQFLYSIRILDWLARDPPARQLTAQARRHHHRDRYAEYPNFSDNTDI